jgi:hypothetical protein
MAQIKQGEDKAVVLIVTDAGNPVDLTTNQKVRVTLEKGATVVDEFSSSAVVPESTVAITDAVNGEITLYVESVKSYSYPVGTVIGVVHVWFTDVNFPDGNRKETFRIAAGSIVPADGADKSL